MSNLQQVKRIVQAKWNKSTGSDSNHSQEELTQQAEKILKKAQSKTNMMKVAPGDKFHDLYIFREQSVRSDHGVCQQNDC